MRIINLFLCLVAVFSAPGNFDARKTVRGTWGKKFTSNPHVRVIFILGKLLFHLLLYCCVLKIKIYLIRIQKEPFAYLVPDQGCIFIVYIFRLNF